MTLHKLASTLEPGDRALISKGRGGTQQTATVLSVVKAEQVVKRAVLLVTFRRPDGVEVQNTYGPLATVRLAE